MYSVVLVLSISKVFKAIASNEAPVFILAIIAYKFFRVLAQKSRLEGGWTFLDELWVFLNHACFFVVIEGDSKYLLVLSFGIYQCNTLIEMTRKSKANKVTRSITSNLG
jgi:hypothetical protein